jgi:adenylate cyclase
MSEPLRARRSLRTRWTLGVLVVALVPLVLLAFLVTDVQRRGLARAEKELEAAVVDEAAQRVLAALDQASDTAARGEAIFLDAKIDLDARTHLLTDLVGRAKAISGISFFDPEGRFVDAVVREGKDDPSLHLVPAREGFRGIESQGTPVLRYERRLMHDGVLRGWLVVGVANAALDERLRDLSKVRFGAADRVYLVDESRLVLAGARAGTRPELPIFDAVTNSNRTFATFATELVLTTEFKDGGTEKVGTIRTLPAQRWALVVERPTAEAFEALTSARNAFLYGLFAAALLAIAAGVIVAQRTLGPIRRLMDLVARYSRREFNARSNVETGDELALLGSSLERMADDLSASEQEIATRARIEANLRRYMPEEAAEAIVKGGEDALDLGGAKRRVTILFADVVAFTGFAERTSPERAVAFLNELFTILSEIVFRHRGMVDKFVGDSIMAVFRPEEEGDDGPRALAAAEDMHAFVASNLKRWQAEYSFAVELGIGIASGDVLLGNLGSKQRMEYTVIGDAVNVAARLESIARPRQTLTTKEVVEACPEVEFASLGAHALRGKEKPVDVYEVVA